MHENPSSCVSGGTHPWCTLKPVITVLTNDSPRCNDWLSSETLAPIESAAKSAHPMQQMEKSPTYYFSIPFLGKF